MMKRLTIKILDIFNGLINNFGRDSMPGKNKLADIVNGSTIGKLQTSPLRIKPPDENFYEMVAFCLESCNITKTRSRHNDTDQVRFTLKVGDENLYPTLEKDMGNVNDGTHSIDLIFGPVSIPDPNTRVVFNYQIYNGGSEENEKIRNLLQAGANKLLEDKNVEEVLASAGATGGVWGLIIAGAIEAFNELMNLGFANCDGLVAADEVVIKGSTLRNWLSNGGTHRETRYYPGYKSSAGCGGNSEYYVTWSVRRVWVHKDLTIATGTEKLKAAGNPHGYAESTEHVVYRGTDGHIHELYFNGREWSYNCLTSAKGAPGASTAIGDPHGYVWNPNDQHVVYRGTDGHIHELYYSNGHWYHNDLSKATGTENLTAAGDPYGYAESTEHVVYRGTDGHIHELYYSNEQWYHNDLSKATGTENLTAAGNPHGYVWNPNDQHVVYRGTDGHIHELFYSNEQWYHNDLSEATGTENLTATGDPHGYTESTQHVVYRGTDGHIHELYFTEQWNHKVLTLEIGAPTAIGDPYGFVTNYSVQHVVYRGTDDHIHELYFTGQWNHVDITRATGAPLSFSSPRGYVWNNIQHVVYMGMDGHIHELYFNAA